MNPTTQPSAKTIRPAATIIHRKDGFVVECDMPGVSREDVQLTVENGVLTIVGRRKRGTVGNPLHRESLGGDYRRAFALEADIDMTRISARSEAGVLQVFLPVIEPPKPRQIAVS